MCHLPNTLSNCVHGNRLFSFQILTYRYEISKRIFQSNLVEKLIGFRFWPYRAAIIVQSHKIWIEPDRCSKHGPVRKMAHYPSHIFEVCNMSGNRHLERYNSISCCVQFKFTSGIKISRLTSRSMTSADSHLGTAREQSNSVSGNRFRSHFQLQCN